MTLGDVINTDGSYTGADGSSLLSVDYYRGKVVELQAVMNGVDIAAASLRDTLATWTFDDDGQADDMQLMLDELEGKRAQFAAVVSAINTASDGLNALGVRFPVLSSNTLGVLPLAAIAVIAGAVAGAAALIVWGKAWIDAVYAKQTALESLAAEYRARAEAAAAIADPTLRDQVQAEIARVDTIQRAIVSQLERTQAGMGAGGGGVGDYANLLKWGAILLGGFMVWRIVNER